MSKPDLKAASETSREDLIRSVIADGLAIQPRFKPEPLYKKTGRGSYQSQSVAEMAAVKAAKR